MTDTWKRIANTPLLAVYIHELYWLAADVVGRAEVTFERTPPPESGFGYIKVEPELHADILALLGSAAKARALITDRGRRRGQSAAAHELLCARARALADLLKGLELGTLRSVDVRHSLEHMDERIDETAEAIAAGTIPAPVSLPLDLTVWDREGLRHVRGPDSEQVLLRTYIASERVFVNTGFEIDIGALQSEARAIVERLQPQVVGSADEGRGASVFVVAPANLRR